MFKRTLLGLCLALDLCRLATAEAPSQSTTIDPKSNWATWEGWGTSLAWWAASLGYSDQAADIAFTRKYSQLFNVEVPGLGLNIIRYVAGASSDLAVDAREMNPGQMYLDRQIQTYWPNWPEGTVESPPSWDWEVDRPQREMMWKARDRGADTFELVAMSPPWWMCINRCPAGADDGTQDNLREDKMTFYAYYLTTIVKFARESWAIPFDSVAPFNAPSDSWSGLNGTQEGCHYQITTQAAVIKHLRQFLDEAGQNMTEIAASDESSFNQAVYTWDGIKNAGEADKVGKINVHGYQYGEGQRDVLYARAQDANRRIWMSEYAKQDYKGMDLVSQIMQDFRWLRPTAWLYWQVFDAGGWGLIETDTEHGSTDVPTQTYFAFAHFTRHIRPGMRILDAGCDYAVAAYDARSSTLVIVAMNWGEPRYLDFDLSHFSTPSAEGHNVARWSSQLGNSTGAYYKPNPDDTKIQGKHFWSWFDTNMTQTFEVYDIVL